MSQLQVLQEDLLKQFGQSAVLKEVIVHYEKACYVNGEVICRVTVNDSSLSEDDEVRLAETPISEIQKILFIMENPDALLVEVMHDWLKGIPEIIKLSDAIAGRIREQGFDSQITSFNHLLDACTFLAASLESVRIMMVNQGKQLMPEWFDLEKEYTQTFSQLIEACQEKNGAKIADIIEYDLASNLQKWLSFLPTVKVVC